MKTNRKNLFVLLLIIVVVTLCSCATTVDVSALMPSETYIGGQTTIAVAPTSITPYQPYGSETAKYSSRIVESALKQGVYNVMGVQQTDAIIQSSKQRYVDPTNELLRAGASILIQTSIDNMDYYDEYHDYVRKDKDGKYTTKIYLERTAQLTMSCIVWDLKTRTIIDAFTLSDNKTSSSHEVHDKDSYLSSIFINTGVLYQDILFSFKDKITKRLVPHYDVVKIKLLKNKTKIEELEPAYDYVKNGQYRMALNAFNTYWERTENPVCGYNCAVLIYALGAQEDAIKFANSVFNVTGYIDLLELIDQLTGLYNLQQSAIAQVDGSLSYTDRGAIISY